MKYIKKLLIILIVFLLTGCNNEDNNINKIMYELNINTTFEENITFFLSKDAYKLAEQNKNLNQGYTTLEYKLLYEDIEPIFSNHDILYKKNINKNFKNIQVKLNYEYIEEDFIYSNYIMNCFENYDIISSKNSLQISLSGKFKCLNDKNEIDIKVSSIFKPKQTNGTLENESYTWKITKDNEDNVNINHVLLRNYDGMVKERIENQTESNFNIKKIIKPIILVTIISALIVIRKKYTKQ